MSPDHPLAARRRKLFDAIIALDSVGLASTEMHVRHLQRIAAAPAPKAAPVMRETRDVVQAGGRR